MPVNGILTALSLLICLVRVLGINREMRGLAELTDRVPLGVGVREASGTRLPTALGLARSSSPTRSLGYRPSDTAWCTTIPDTTFSCPSCTPGTSRSPTRFRYVIARDPKARATSSSSASKRGRSPARVLGSLHEDRSAPPFDLPVGTVLRYGQDFGELSVDRSVAKKALVVAGTRYSRGLGTQARSLIQLRPNASGHLRGCLRRRRCGEWPW